MKNSLEVRPPFLDNDLVDFAFRIPGEYKIKNSNPKIILKEAFSDFVPQSVINRKKVGFVAPMEEMFVKKNLPKIRSVLSRKNLKSHNFFPLGLIMYAFLTFHSLGIVQSLTFVPDLITKVLRLIFFEMILCVFLTSFPVKLLLSFHKSLNKLLNSFLYLKYIFF